ncbi:DUF192 domain-containing protein [Croceiramulus getboli]|nr:DUF192 domain-containing protein [Flavobacteriaceae bacterium YJPT1-3]
MRILMIFLLVALTTLSCQEQKKAPSVQPSAPQFTQEGELKLIKQSGDTLTALKIEIADNDYETETGLMHRTQMQDDQGMLFVFEDERPHSFYMKNTLIPLDIIWIGADQVIKNISENAQPMDETSIFSEADVQYVLEVNAGLVEQWGLEIGDQIVWKRR